MPKSGHDDRQRRRHDGLVQRAKNAPSTTTATMRTCTPVIFPLAGIEEVEDIGTPIVRP